MAGSAPLPCPVKVSHVLAVRDGRTYLVRLVATSTRPRDVTISLYSTGWRYTANVPVVRFEGSLVQPLPQAGSWQYPVRSFESEELAIVLPQADNLIGARAEGEDGCAVTFAFTPAAQEGLGIHPLVDLVVGGPVKRDSIQAITMESLPAPGCDVPYAAVHLAKVKDPDFPELARQQGVHGSVFVAVRVAGDGSVISSETVKSSGHAVLDSAGRRAAIESSYDPAVFRCERTSGELVLRADFILNRLTESQTQLSAQ
jgi:TonB family protein